MIPAEDAVAEMRMVHKGGNIQLFYDFFIEVPQQAYSDCSEIHLTNVVKGMEAVPNVF